MTDPDQKLLDAIAAMSVTLRQKVKQRDMLGVQIMELEKNIRNMRMLVIGRALGEDSGARDRPNIVGLTEAVRTVLRRAEEPMLASTVKTALIFMGFDLKRFKNPSAVVHNTLIRMAKAGEINFDEESRAYWLPEKFGFPGQRKK